MCEILGFSAKSDYDIRDYMREFYQHSAIHKHGWGMVWQDNGYLEVLKEPVQATKSKQLSDILESMQPQTMTMAHIRYATTGSVNIENCHPFSGTDVSGREWQFIHNGIIYAGELLERYRNFQTGTTDSERAFLYLIDKVNTSLSQKGNLSETERFEAVEQVAGELSPGNKLNFIAFDGELLYVHKNLEDTLFCRKLKSGILFATTPLDMGDWKPVPLTRLCAFKDGEQVHEGIVHGKVFIPNEDYLSRMEAMARLAETE